ncbi:MAG: hypothetical protein KGL18_14565 [Burkholderiales bacterium]|nr:hypothetical protein [Burkholderiales bacterium]MDE2504183.1 hypothetical protein [Burkholderiales bacterium]
MNPSARLALLSIGILAATAARGDDLDALSLQSAPVSGPASALSAAVELALGRIDQRGEPKAQDGRRASLDLRYTPRLSDAWRAGLSARVDDTHPAPGGQHTTVASLREAYLGWTTGGSLSSFDIGRINLRQGPAYGYNPTDYFRTNALRTIPTADPLILRQMRLGTGMLRAGRLWDGGGATLALAPKLASAPDSSPSAADFGATNSTDRALLGIDLRASDRLSGQGSLLLSRGHTPILGLSGTALAGDAVVVYGEWSYGRVPTLAEQILNQAQGTTKVSQASLGLTWTLPGGLALTTEAEYNGAGLDRAQMQSVLAQGPAAYQQYFALTQPSQELGSRRAWLLYATQKGFGIQQLDLTAFLRSNADDHSALAWAELRYHWPRFDAALQWQQSFGAAGTEYHALPYRRVVQVVASAYF